MMPMKAAGAIQWFFALSCIVLFGLMPCSSKAQGQNTGPAMDKDTILIVYLSRTGNTQAIAGIIHEEVGGTLVGLELKTPYPKDYQAIVAQVVREDETGYLPPLKTKIHDLQKYRTVFIGFPTWNMQLPPPVRSFLKAYNLSGKTVISFNTNGGYGTGSSFQEINKLCPDSTVLKGFSIRGGSERDGIHLAIKGEPD